MNQYEIKQELQTDKYDFLRERKDIILLTLAGSHAYGVDVETSDLDLRGIYLNSPEEILLMNDSQSYLNNTTDTTLYSFNYIVQLLTKGNPNLLELLGSKPEHYFKLDEIGEKLIQNKKWFLSKKCIPAFYGYAYSHAHKIKHLLQINKDEPSVDRDKKICKCMYHTLRIYMIGTDILEQAEIITYREKERDLLLSIRSGDFYKDGQVTEEFYKMIKAYRNHYAKAAESTLLPDCPNLDEINKFRMEVNLHAVQQGV